MNTRVRFLWDRQYLEVYIYKLRILKLDIKETRKYAVDNLSKYNFKKEDLKYFELIKSINFRLIKVRICGFQGDYASWAIAYGLFWGILSYPRNHFEKKDIKYVYQVDFYGEPFIAFESIFYFKLGKILLNTYRLRRNIRGKRSSNS